MNLSNKFSKKAGVTFYGNVGGPNLSSIPATTLNTKHSNFLYVYFWFAYILLLSPFRFQKIGPGIYKVYRWQPQQWLCGFSTSLSLLRIFTSLRRSILTIQAQNPVTFFLMFCECSSFFFKITAFRLLWTKSDKFERLINFLNSPYLLPYNPFKMESVISISIFCGAYAALSFLRMFFGSGVINYWDWSPEWLYRRLVAVSRFTFFQTNNTDSSFAPALEDITTGDHFFTVLQALSMQCRFITGFFVDLFIVLHVLTLWAPASGFSLAIYSQLPALLIGNKMREKEGLVFDIRISSAATIMESDLALKQFEALKNLSILVEQAVGDVILPYIGEALFYYAIYFDSVVMTPDVFNRVVLIFFYMSALCILMFSAEIVRKMRWFKTWLDDKSRVAVLGHNELAIVLDDLIQDSVGISASGVFTINYTFVGAVVSVLITYFIIRLQSGGVA